MMGDFVQAIFWLLLLMGLVLAGFFGVVILRRRLKEDQPTNPAETFTLGDLRQLLRQGQITQAEYDTLHDQIVHALKPKDKPTEGNPPPTDRAS
jgi:hypothetical protein